MLDAVLDGQVACRAAPSNTRTDFLYCIVFWRVTPRGRKCPRGRMHLGPRRSHSAKQCHCQSTVMVCTHPNVQYFQLTVTLGNEVGSLSRCQFPAIDVHRKIDNRDSDEPGLLGTLVETTALLNQRIVRPRSGGCWRTNVSVGLRIGSH